MIIDHIKNLSSYQKLSVGIKKAVKFIEDNNLEEINAGTYKIDGNKVYALIQDYTPKDAKDGKWEAHRQYIDIQYIVSGKEKMGYANIEQMDVSQEYSEDDDYLLLEGHGNFIDFEEGMFAIFYPQDVHMPGIVSDNKNDVRKVVIKVKKGQL